MADLIPQILTTALDAVNDAVLGLSTEGEVLYANRALRKLFQSQPRKTALKTWGSRLRLYWPDDSTPCEPSRLPWNRILSGEQLRSEQYLYLRAKGTRRARIAVQSISIPNRRAPVALLLIFREIAGDEPASAAFEAGDADTERMESLARLAGGVAHDFNNVLTVISGYAQMLDSALERNASADLLRSYIDDLLVASKRATGMTDLLLAFARRKTMKARLMDLNQLLRDSEPAFKEALGQECFYAAELTEQPCLISADPGHIEQLILNLAAYAREMMPGGGRFTVRTRVDPALHGETASRSVVLVCEDSGGGIDELAAARVFEPFFTGKPKERRNALVLAAAYGAVKQAGGTIACHSALGRGTRFEIKFPERPGVPEQPAVEHDPAPMAEGGAETILIVEDDADVRNLIDKTLSRLGYGTLIAEDGQKALEVFRANQAKIDMVLTDVVMPRMNGRELAVELRRASPRLPILFISGYPGEEKRAREPAKSALLLRKPFLPQKLAEFVRRTLDTPVDNI